MTDMLLVQILVSAYFVFTFIVWFIDWRKGYLKLSVKQSVNDMRFSLTMIWAMSIVVIGLVTVGPLVTQWQLATTTSSPFGQWFISKVDNIFGITLIVLGVWLIKKSAKPWWGYTEEERDSIYESQMKTRAKLPVYLKWLYPDKKVKVKI